MMALFFHEKRRPLMATDVILPALGMTQETGKVVQWLKAEGEQVTKGQPIVEVETDKATVELEAPADGVLTGFAATAGDDVPVGQVIAKILAPHEAAQAKAMPLTQSSVVQLHNTQDVPPTLENQRASVSLTPPSRLASRIADEYKVDLNSVTPTGRRIQKADVLAYLQNQQHAEQMTSVATETRVVTASPKARRLAKEQGKDIAVLKGTGPDGAVLAADVLAVVVQTPQPSEETTQFIPVVESPSASTNGTSNLNLSNIWRIMAERTTQSWTSVPHFYLVREVNGSRLITWREEIMKRSSAKITYTDLLVKIVATALRVHPRINASWSDGKITLKPEVHMGLAVAVEDGLVVPVIHHADALGLAEIARQRMELVAKAQGRKLRPQDIGEGTFTISNLGMYKVDAFNAIINQPQVAILAVGRITERVVPVHGQPAVQPMLVLTLSCDHRAVDGARGAQFLDSVANLIEEPLGLLV